MYNYPVSAYFNNSTWNIIPNLENTNDNAKGYPLFLNLFQKFAELNSIEYYVPNNLTWGFIINFSRHFHISDTVIMAIRIIKDKVHVAGTPEFYITIKSDGVYTDNNGWRVVPCINADKRKILFLIMHELGATHLFDYVRQENANALFVIRILSTSIPIDTIKEMSIDEVNLGEDYTDYKLLPVNGSYYHNMEITLQGVYSYVDAFNDALNNTNAIFSAMVVGIKISWINNIFDGNNNLFNGAAPICAAQFIFDNGSIASILLDTNRYNQWNGYNTFPSVAGYPIKISWRHTNNSDATITSEFYGFTYYNSLRGHDMVFTYMLFRNTNPNIPKKYFITTTTSREIRSSNVLNNLHVDVNETRTQLNNYGIPLPRNSQSATFNANLYKIASNMHNHVLETNVKNMPNLSKVILHNAAIPMGNDPLLGIQNYTDTEIQNLDPSLDIKVKRYTENSIIFKPNIAGKL